MVYGLKDDEDWEDEENWYKVKILLLDIPVDIERLRDAYREAKQNPADEVTFKMASMQYVGEFNRCMDSRCDIYERK